METWKLQDYITHLTPQQWKKIETKTGSYISKLTKDRAGPYWENKMNWIHHMLKGSFYEPASVKNHIILQIRHFPLKFSEIMNLHLYEYICCGQEMFQYCVNNKIHPSVLLQIFKKSINKQPITKREQQILNKKTTLGLTFQDAIRKFYKFFKKYGFNTVVTI